MEPAESKRSVSNKAFFYRKRRIVFIVSIILAILLIALLFFFTNSFTEKPVQRLSLKASPAPSLPLRSSVEETAISPLLFSEYEEDTDELFIYHVGYDGSNRRLIDQITDSNIKALQKLDDDRFVFIGNLDGMGRGDGVYVINSNLKTQISKLITAPKGYVFDQVYLSPDKNKLVVWEFEDKFYLKESLSRIVLYEDITGQPVRRVLLEQQGSLGRVSYPVFWGKDNRTLYVDSLDTKGEGIYHGFFSVNVVTGAVDEILGDGLYSSLPVLSPDGNLMIFTAYDAKLAPVPRDNPSKLSPMQVVNPNTIVVYDLNEKGVHRLLSIKNTLFYNLIWGPSSDKLAVKAVNPVKETTQLVILNVDSGKVIHYLDTEAGVFAWKKSDKIVLSQRVEGFFGAGVFSGNPIPAKGVYLYDFNSKTYKKVYSDSAIQLIE